MHPDIVIIGGGPGGLSTALHIARFAPHLVPRVLVLEKARYPRPKLCGGALVVDAEVVLERLGLDVTEIPHVDTAEAHFDFQGRGLVVKMPNRHALRMVRRDEFDAWLAAKTRSAGIEIREGVCVRRVEPRSDCVLIHTGADTIRSVLAVGADGSNGITRRSILPNAKHHTARLLEIIVPASGSSAESQGSDSSGDTRPHRPAVAYFEFSPVPQGITGYLWDFPTQLGGRPVRCWGIYDTNVSAGTARPSLRDPLSEEMGRHGVVLDQAELQGHPIRWFTPRTEFSVPRVLLVGDALGADGIFGEGISFALGSGRLAAQVIRDAMVSGDLCFRSYRRRVLTSSMGQALTVRTAITHVLYRLRWAWFQRFFWRVFKPVVLAFSWAFVLNWARRMK